MEKDGDSRGFDLGGLPKVGDNRQRILPPMVCGHCGVSVVAGATACPAWGRSLDAAETMLASDAATLIASATQGAKVAGIGSASGAVTVPGAVVSAGTRPNQLDGATLAADGAT